MLRVGLTGDLGSGKSTVARMLAERGVVVLSSDEMARAMMQPGRAVYAEIVERFGSGVVAADGTLNRRRLASIAFDPEHPQVEELNAIIHPAVIAAQEEQIAELARTHPDAIVVVESALIFSAKDNSGSAKDGGRPWRERFDCVVLVTAPDAVKVARFVKRAADGRTLSDEEREALAADARHRLAQQASTGIVVQVSSSNGFPKAELYDAAAARIGESFLLSNDGSEQALEASVEALVPVLRGLEEQRRPASADSRPNTRRAEY